MPVFFAMFRILRIRMFLSLLDPHPDPSIDKQKMKKNLDFYCSKNDVNVPSQRNKNKYLEKKIIFGVGKVTDEKRRIRIRIH